MDVEETKCSSGYGKPPWIFKGRALYQFHLVKAEIARAIIPKEFKLVEAFGYTLGGFFLANYSESPFGTFDEGLSGIRLRLMPRVYVNSDEACRHGRKEFGLPSHVGRFTKSVKAVSKRPQRNDMDIHVAEIDGLVATNLYDIRLTSPVLKTNPLKWMSFGPNIKMSLPSFSGHTKDKPQLLKYSCQIECRW
ncbi:hypothetical protein CTI12_AA459870 [Artemisia annua]|uniref:Uncharacterized protein n=1 Tax=Artemisia annua TaxID=35608 RepID=A0A2U1LS94_ARTAN|nr:hypothetical protein CTI12_AA459870 [Artemisia annua]